MPKLHLQSIIWRQNRQMWSFPLQKCHLSHHEYDSASV